MAKSIRPTLDYLPANTIIDGLLEAGERPTAEKVRAILGRGSYEVLQGMIRQRLRERGLAQEDEEDRTTSSAPTVPIPAPDPTQVTAALQALRQATHMARATAMAERFNGGVNGGHPR